MSSGTTVSQPRSEENLAASHAPVISLNPFYLWLLFPSPYFGLGPESELGVSHPEFL